jgi:PAS domain S-box-containing protein
MEGNFKVEDAISVDDAFRKMGQQTYDAIISDYEMPQKNGLDFLKELRQQKNEIPFILFTGKGREDVTMTALNLGADGYYDKHGSPETVYGELAYGIRLSVRRRTAEREILQGAATLKAMLDSSPDAIMILDLNGNVVDCNEAALRLGEYSSKEEVVGKNGLDFIVEKDRKQAIDNLSVIFKQGTIRTVEYTALKKNGEEYLAELSANIIRDSTGNPTGFISAIKDMTERKQIEEEKSRLLRDLQKRAKELNCLYGISRLFEKSDIPLDGALQETADLLPPAMQYPDIACARIVVENREFSTKNFKETRWTLQADIKILGKKAGSVEVRYLEERPTIAEDPFLEEERNLIDVVAERLGKIIERRDAEKRLQESEERFKAVFEGVNDGILVADVKTKRFVSANPRICEITGYSLEELLKLGVGDIHPKKDLPYVIDSFTKQMQGKLTLSMDIPVLRKDERVVYCDVNSKPIKIGSQECLIGLFRDATERRKAEERLKEAEEKHRTLLNSANVLVQSVNAEGRFVFVNEEWKKMLGYTDLDLEGITMMNVVRKDHLQYCMSVFRQVMNGMPIHDIETVFVAKDGREIVVSGNACPIFKDGAFVSTVAFFVDITERKKNEEKLRESSRRIDLMNEKLRVWGGLTRHDVRNKLSTVTGYAYLLKKKHADQADIIDGLEKMEQAVKDSMRIFEFAKIYEQIGVEELTYVDVETTVNEAGALFPDLTIKVVNGCHGLTVLADSFLRQLFYNFIDNTRKYGQKTTGISVYYEKAEAGGLLLVYEDDGAGISAENKLNLFRQGFSTGGSTGFGLFLIKKMMDVYGWAIQETGEAGKGAKFVITIPRVNQNGKENFQIA